jgi:hypothetical protein
MLDDDGYSRTGDPRRRRRHQTQYYQGDKEYRDEEPVGDRRQRMAKVSSGRSKAARRADSESYLTVLPTPEMPYETESADQAYLRQAPRRLR